MDKQCLIVRFNNIPIILTTGLTITPPQYVTILDAILKYIVVLGVLGIVFYYIYRKYKSIDNYINRKYPMSNNGDSNNKADTYKDEKKSYKEEVSDLGANTLPDAQTIVNIAGKVIEFMKPKQK